jgi:iron complex outermembrane receptor protein
MNLKWTMYGKGVVGLTVGLWLLMNQAAIANQLLEGKPHRTGKSLELDAVGASALLVDAGLQSVAQVDVVEITGIQLEETAAGFRLRLETDGVLVAPETVINGNAAIADIPNAVLNLPDGEDFFASTPAEGIALVNITNLADDQVRIAITGTDAPPAVTISPGAAGLTVSAMAGEPTASPGDEAIQIMVTGEGGGSDYFVPNASTATGTDTPILDIPASIRVIPRQVLEDQQATDLGDALRNVSGASVSETEGRGIQLSLRGFEGGADLSRWISPLQPQ